MGEPSQKSLEKMRKFVKGYAAKSGTAMHPNKDVT
jgi:ferredoxin-thioredoxin reductase catalytic chain